MVVLPEGLFWTICSLFLLSLCGVGFFPWYAQWSLFVCLDLILICGIILDLNVWFFSPKRIAVISAWNQETYTLSSLDSRWESQALCSLLFDWTFSPLFLCPFCTHICLYLFLWHFHCRIILFLSKLAIWWLLLRILEHKALL